ncbi:SecDF P1 head subdomain-containing protein [Herbaspirillum sp. NPDC087042]|uniref:SecDF P1 head subdomain-containing protein n=1 Tax=Herbaspirillum sp. NPDC087042 TaxID=3364004 RepID=UPI00380DA9CE
MSCGLPAAPRRRQLLIAGAATLVLALAGCASSGGLSSSSLFELRGATTVPTQGWIKVRNPQSPGGDLYLAPRAALDASDVQRATAQKDAAGRAVLVLQFSPVGTLRLAAASRELQGKQLAALLEGQVVNVVSVQGNMSINTMALTGLASFEDAVRLAHQLSPRQ